MPELHLFPVGEIFLLRPDDKFSEQRCVGARGVVRLPAFVSQELQKIFNERLHVRRITKVARRRDDENARWKDPENRP